MVRHVTGWHKKEIDLIKNISTKLKCEYPCQECGLKFITKHSKFVHRLLHHYYDTDGKCSLCDLKFINRTGSLMHRRRIHKYELHAFNKEFSAEDRTLSCQYCEKSFFTEGSLKYHKERDHLGLQKLNRIEKGEKKQKPRQNIFSAIDKFAINDLSFTCFFCPDKIKGTENLLGHCQSVHNKKDKPDGDYHVKCMVCLRSIRKAGIEKHRFIHNEIKLFECKLCYNKFKQYANIYRHYHLNHQSEEEQKFIKQGTPDDLKFQCHNCDKKFLTASLLQCHEKKEQNGKLFTNIAATNIKRRHGGITAALDVDYTCFFCPEKIKGMRNLVEHCQNVHNRTDEPNGLIHVKCMVCQKNVQKYSIDKHRLTHNVTKLFECKLCYHKFSQHSNLLSHIRKFHTSDEEKRFMIHSTHEDLKYNCNNCELKFLNFALLRAHEVEEHAFKTTISCEFCAREFSWKNRHNLKLHMKSIHGLDDYNVMDQALTQDKDDTVTVFMNMLNSL